MSNLADNAQMVPINAIYILLAASALKILAQKHIQKIPYAKLVTPSKNETEITEPVPVRIENATFLPEPRIIGGEPADIKDFPFMVNVLKEGKHFCGGSYIKPTWVLTAAHCLIHPRIILPLPTKLFTVKMGATLLEGDEYEQERRAVSVISHADFHYYNNSCDIGLIEIDKPFDLNERIKFVEIPVKFDIYEDENCTVVGWGVLREEDVNYERFSNRLQKVTVPVVDESVCKQIYSTPKYSKLFQDHKTICAGYLGGGRDACQGDSGGPLLLNGIQIGVVSWGIGCGNEIPGVYTNTYYYRDWIDELVARTPYIVHRRQDSKSERSRSTISIPVMDEPILSDAAGMLIGINVITLLMLILVIFTFESEVKICNIMLTNKNNHAFNVIFHP